MRKMFVAAAAVTTVAFGLACSGLPMPSGGSNDNVGACKRYVDAYNGLECIPDAAKLKSDDMCPAALDMSPCDLSEYYDCMAGAAKCNGNIPDLGGQSSCGTPTCN